MLRPAFGLFPSESSFAKAPANPSKRPILQPVDRNWICAADVGIVYALTPRQSEPSNTVRIAKEKARELGLRVLDDISQP